MNYLHITYHFSDVVSCKKRKEKVLIFYIKRTTLSELMNNFYVWQISRSQLIKFVYTLRVPSAQEKNTGRGYK